jgi:hypothetical protein
MHVPRRTGYPAFRLPLDRYSPFAASPRRAAVALAVVWSCFASRAAAQERVASLGQDGLPGTWRVPSPTAPGSWVGVTAAGGYGYTESILGQQDQHHRASGSIAVSARPLSWLAFALRLDGRYDAHTVAGAYDDGVAGDPRLIVRASGRVSGAFGLGGQLSLWAPGGPAPSIVPAALTLDAQVFGGYVPEHGRVSVVGRLGFRADQSARSAPDAPQLSASDRLSLGVSSFHAVLLGAAASGRFGVVEPWFETTFDALVGAGAPLASSPLHVLAGVRLHPFASAIVQPGLFIDVSPSARASLDPAAPLVAMDPRVSVMLTLGVGLGAIARRPTTDTLAVRGPANGQGTTTNNTNVAATPATGVAEGVIRDPSGAPVADAIVTLRREGRPSREARTDQEGRFRIEAVEAGEHELVIRAPSGAERSQALRVSSGAGAVARVEVTIEGVTTTGSQLRGAVRSYDGAPVRASARVSELDRSVTCGEDGTFRISVEPRTYTVSFEAEGYEPQRRRVTVGANGVVILNIDLRPRRRAP